MKQVITIGPDGSIKGLQHKRGKGLDLRQFGRASIKRETIIQWDDVRQAWFILWKDDDETEAWRDAQFVEAGIEQAQLIEWGAFVVTEDNGIVWFRDYEDAVLAEVAVIQALQVSGRFDFHRHGVS